MKALKEIYGVGVLFFYYMKYLILFGWPLLRFGLDYEPNIIIDILWVYCLLLVIKDIIYKFILKKSYCEEAQQRHSASEKPGKK